MIRFFNNEFRFAFSSPPRAFSYPFTKAFYQRIMRSVVRLFVVSFPFRVETAPAKVHTWAVMLKVNCFTSLQKGHLQSELYIFQWLSSLRRVFGFACFSFWVYGLELVRRSHRKRPLKNVKILLLHDFVLFVF